MAGSEIASRRIVDVIDGFPFVLMFLCMLVQNKTVGGSTIDECYEIVGTDISIPFLAPSYVD